MNEWVDVTPLLFAGAFVVFLLVVGVWQRCRPICNFIEVLLSLNEQQGKTTKEIAYEIYLSRRLPTARSNREAERVRKHLIRLVEHCHVTTRQRPHSNETEYTLSKGGEAAKSQILKSPDSR